MNDVIQKHIQQVRASSGDAYASLIEQEIAHLIGYAERCNEHAKRVDKLNSEVAAEAAALRARVAELERVLQRAGDRLLVVEAVNPSEKGASILREISRLSGNKAPGNEGEQRT